MNLKMTNTSTSPGLGLLQKLPIELRNDIYEYCMPWNTYNTWKAFAHKGARQEYMEWNMEHCLILLRISHALFEEVCSVLYGSCDLIFRVSPSEVSDELMPHVDVIAEHAQRGLFSLPSLSVMAWRYPSRAMYQAFPLQRWRSLCIELDPVRQFRKEDLIFSWQAMKLLTEILENKDLSTIHVKLQEMRPYHKAAWFDIRKDRMFRTMRQCTEEHMAGDIQVLLVAFNRVCESQKHGPKIMLHAQSNIVDTLSKLGPEFGSICVRDSTVFPQHLGPISGMKFLVLGTSSFKMLDLTDWTPPPDLSKSDIQEAYVELCLGHYLDRFTGKTAVNLRQERLRHWNAQYERRLLTAVSILEEDDMQYPLASILENWAVLRTFDPDLHEKDLAEWHSIPKDEFKKCVNQSQSKEILQVRKEQQKRRLSYKIAKQDEESRELKRKSLFNHRRILVTDFGIFWDPDHTEFTKHKSCRPRNDVFFIHEPQCLSC